MRLSASMPVTMSGRKPAQAGGGLAAERQTDIAGRGRAWPPASSSACNERLPARAQRWDAQGARELIGRGVRAGSSSASISATVIASGPEATLTISSPAPTTLR